MNEDTVETATTVTDPELPTLKIDLEDPSTLEAIARVAHQISLRYRNGFTLVGVSGEAGETYFKALSAALLAFKCRHTTTMLEARVLAFKGKPATVVINNPSPHLFRKRPTVLAVADLTDETAKDVVYFGNWLMAKGVKKLEVSTYRRVGPVPKWFNPDYIAFLEEVPPEAIALQDMPEAQSL